MVVYMTESEHILFSAFCYT